MMRRMLFVSLLPFVFACRGTGAPPIGDAGDRDAQPDVTPDVTPDTPGDVTPDGDGGTYMCTSTATVYTVNQIQDATATGHPTAGTGTSPTWVRLEGVVATTPKGLISCRTCLYGIWVADPSGGQYSGVLVLSSGMPNSMGGMCAGCAGGGAIPNDAAVGDIFNIQAQYEEYHYCTGAGTCTGTSCASCTALDPDYAELTRPCEITRTSSGATVGAPVTVTDMASLVTAPGVANPYRGALIDLAPAGGMMTGMCDTFGDCPLMPTGTPYGLQLHDLFVGPGALMSNHAYTSITGVLYFSFGNWKIEPRTSADIL